MGLGRTLRVLKRKRWIIITVVVLSLAFGGFLALRYAWLVRCERRVTEYSHQIQLAIIRWNFDNLDLIRQEGVAIPDGIAEYIKEGYLDQLPVNPFTGEQVRILEWGDPPTPGDITLLRAKGYFVLDGEQTESSDTGFHSISYSVRVQVAPQWQKYIDSDDNGFADPIICIMESGIDICTKGGPGNRSYNSEPLGDVFARHGYTRDLYSSLPTDTRPFWRWMFCLKP